MCPGNELVAGGDRVSGSYEYETNMAAINGIGLYS
jgi:hypothetical protein